MVGRLIVLSLVHGGPAPRAFSKNTYNRLCDKPLVKCTIQDVEDTTFKEKLNMVSPIVPKGNVAFLYMLCVFDDVPTHLASYGPSSQFNQSINQCQAI